MLLYASLLLCCFIIPFVMSFDKNLKFYKQFRYLFPAIIVVATVYISFDVYFTKIGIWGFNPSYHLPLKILGLPVEECLFFIVIPYSSIFIHETFVYYFPRIELSDKISNFFSIILIITSIILAILNSNKTYTFFVSIITIVVLTFSLLDKSRIINRFYVTFLIISIALLLVNGILTGSFIGSEVVWYNDNENLGIRILTFPVEDFFYGFTLILSILLIREQLKKFY